MNEKEKIPGTKQVPLTREEVLAKKQALANMQTMTMRRAIFNTLRPCPVPFPTGEFLRKRVIALLIVHEKDRNQQYAYFLLDDQTYIRGSPLPVAPDDWWPEGYRFLLDLPYVQVT